MEEISTLWITCNRSGKIELFTEEPTPVEGEYYGNSSEPITISPELLNENITYGDGPKRAYLTFRKV